MNEVIISQLKNIFGENNVFLDKDSKLLYGTDLTQDLTLRSLPCSRRPVHASSTGSSAFIS